MVDTTPVKAEEEDPIKGISLIAVIFDLGNRAKQPSLIAALIGGKDQIPAPSTIIIPPLPRKNSNGVMEIDHYSQILLCYGTNMGIDRDRWAEIEKNPPANLGELYFNTGCFTIVRPTKAFAASGYHHFSEKDALLLVNHTVSESDLEAFSREETRASVKLQIQKQYEALQEDLASRKA